MSKTETTSINISDLNVKLYLDPDNFPEELKTPLSQTYDPESSYAMSGVAIGEALKPVYDKISTVLGGVDQTYSPRSASAQSGIAVKQAIDDVENRIKEFDNALEGCNDAVIMAREAANRAAASSISAQKSASTAVFAKSDLETARDTAVSAATTATDAASAASSVKSYLETARDTAVSAAATATNAAAAAATSETNATTAASTATAQAEAAAVSATHADTDARAVAIIVPRAEAAQQAAADSATAAAASATDAAASATAAAAVAQELLDEELERMVDLAAACYAIMQANPDVKYDYTSEQVSPTDRRARIALRTDTDVVVNTQILVSRSTSFTIWPAWTRYSLRVYYAPRSAGFSGWWNNSVMDINKPVYIHMPACKRLSGAVGGFECKYMIFSNETVFDYLEQGYFMLPTKSDSTVVWNESAITMPRLKTSNGIFANCLLKALPDGITFENLEDAYGFVGGSALEKMPTNTNLGKVKSAQLAFYGCTQMEIDEIVRVCNTLQDLQALETPTTAPLGLPVTCKHDGVSVDCENHLNANYPDFLITLAAKGWTVSFSDGKIPG